MENKVYIKIDEIFNTEKKRMILIRTNQALTLLGYISYPVLLLCSFLYAKEKLIQLLCIPAIGFLLLTLIRKKIGRKRPYEIYDFTPIIKKDTKGNSMPSRHVFSLSIIAFSYFTLYPTIGVFLVICSILIALIRFIGGVHHFSDVVVAILCALLWSLLYLL